jgi:hypothetical protein
MRRTVETNREFQASPTNTHGSGIFLNPKKLNKHQHLPSDVSAGSQEYFNLAKKKEIIMNTIIEDAKRSGLYNQSRNSKYSKQHYPSPNNESNYFGKDSQRMITGETPPVVD